MCLSPGQAQRNPTSRTRNTISNQQQDAKAIAKQQSGTNKEMAMVESARVAFCLYEGVFCPHRILMSSSASIQVPEPHMPFRNRTCRSSQKRSSVKHVCIGSACSAYLSIPESNIPLPLHSMSILSPPNTESHTYHTTPDMPTTINSHATHSQSHTPLPHPT